MKEYELLNEDPAIRTISGKWVNVFEPTEDMFLIEDIAHALSHQCRFSGHLKYFYSVAQHSIECYRIACEQKLDKKELLTALMHDSSEAYLVDIPRPIKKQFPQYKIIENNVMTILSTKFNFTWPLSENIKKIDDIMLDTEWNNLMINDISYLDVYSQSYAKELFLKIFNELAK